MRTLIFLALVIAVSTVAFALKLPADKGSYHLFVMALIGLPGFACCAYGVRLSDQEHAREPDRFKLFTGTSNLPIFGALWRASQAGDHVAKLAFAGTFVLPLVGISLIIFDHEITSWLTG